MGRLAGRGFKEFCQPGQEVNDLFTVMTEDLALRLQAAPVATFRTRARLRTRCSCVTPPAIEGRRAAEAQIIPGTG